ncbi:putative transcriptional regulatory protein [Erysiphe neolycopersici]|uniref:Putative transcriptional regulatory protein n=1 Tax=Erysiphe neolycopersici TaxID=212602 RepID=A0A420HI92_9PEZI|nr:putative transcriptional regulatory protein [Erysiphe neolycopersici]
MAALFNELRIFHPKNCFCIHGSFRLLFSTKTIVNSGHNRWSKIKHEKGAADAKKNRVRSSIAGELTLASKLYGPDPNLNPRLATLITNAKKDTEVFFSPKSDFMTYFISAGFPKVSMEAAIARGQGKSTSGNKLESLMLEAIMPPSIALIIECETDNKSRTLMDLRFKIKYHGGIVTPTSYLFKRKGKLVLEKNEKIKGVDDVLDAAIDAGAEDVDTYGEDSILVWTEPSKTFSTLEELQSKLELKVKSSEIIWDANRDTVVPLIDIDAVKINHLIDLVNELQEYTDVQGVFANVSKGSLSDDQWVELQSGLNA